jgi:hypothetical protein
MVGSQLAERLASKLGTVFLLARNNQLVEVEVWDYDPGLFFNNGHVDLLSLYASLKEETDERIEQALEEVLQGESWYTG